jgi:hypothetical protein
MYLAMTMFTINTTQVTEEVDLSLINWDTPSHTHLKKRFTQKESQVIGLVSRRVDLKAYLLVI